MCHSFLCAFRSTLHHALSDQCVSILMKSHLAGDLVLNNYKVTILLQFFIFSPQGASALNKMSGKQWPKIKVNSMLVTWCIFYRSNLAGTYGTFYQSYEISDHNFLQGKDLPSRKTWFHSFAFYKVRPSLNTQSCIKGLLVVRDFCFWAV